MSRSSLRGTSSFARLLRSRSDFTSCRVERLPSRTFVFDLPHPFRHGFEAFPAVYRAPSLFWHLLVMNFQQFTDTPGGTSATDLFATPFPVSLTAGLSQRPGFSRYAYALERQLLSDALIQGKQTLFGLPWAFCGPGGFSPLATLRLHPLEVYFLVLLGGGADWIAADIFFRSSPLTRWPVILAELGIPENHCLQVYLADWFFRALVSQPRFDASGTCARSSSALIYPAYRWRQASSRALPFIHCYSLGRRSRRIGQCFSRARGGLGLPTWVCDEVRYPRSWMFPFQGFPQDSFSS